jgi:hypothetical protein
MVQAATKTKIGDLMTIKEIQARVGTLPDGIWGPKSRAAAQAHLQRMMPNPNPWPADDDAAMRAFYGNPGQQAGLVNVAVDHIDVRFAGQKVRTIRCHPKISQSLLAFFEDIAKSRHAPILQRYAGCYNFRPMRGGIRMSKHAWGAAVDLDPAPNGLRTPWPAQATMHIEVMEMAAKYGIKAAGAAWGRDSMHYEWTR